MIAPKKIFLIIINIFSTFLFSCFSIKKPCEKINYAYDVLELIPSGYTRADNISKNLSEAFKEATGIVNLIINGSNSRTTSKGINYIVPIVFPVDLERVQCKGIPVYLTNNSISPPCEVPRFKRVIIVDKIYPKVFSNTFFSDNIFDSLELIRLPHLLAISLLHELGHIINLDYEKEINWEEILRGDSLNIESTRLKEIEQSADDFASFEILSACQDESNYARRSMGFNLTNTMKMVLYNLNIKRQSEIKKGIYKTIDDYYKDQGYTHKNLDLRFRQIFHITTMKGGESITDFHNQRNNSH